MYTESVENAAEGKSHSSKPSMYIHAGLPKTGTTSIQRFLQTNREELKQHGVLYPATGIHGTGHVKFAIPFLNQQYHHRMRESNLLCEGDSADHTKRQIENEISESGSRIDTVVISAESFDGTDTEGIDRLFRLYGTEFQIKVIIYIRRQDKYAESLHAQAYRVREMAFDRDQFLKKGFFAYDHYVNLWTKTLGADNLVLREYPENARDGQLIGDFLQAISLDSFPIRSGDLRLNTRMDRLALEFMRHHTGLRFGNDLYFRADYLLGKYSQIHKFEKKFRYFYSPWEHQLILENSRKSNQYLSEKYFNACLFEGIPVPDLEAEWEHFPGLSHSQIESIDTFLKEHRFGIRALNRA